MNTMKKIKGYLSSIRILPILGFICIALIIFWAGMAVGYRKAMFSYHWHSNYAEQFAQNGSMLDLPTDNDSDNMPNPHGAFGMIVSVQLPTMIIKGPVEAEKTIVISTSTLIRDIHDQTASTSLSAGQNVVVIGEPDEQGRIIASFVRILPNNPPQSLGQRQARMRSPIGSSSPQLR
jgi:hypothetical protein